MCIFSFSKGLIDPSEGSLSIVRMQYKKLFQEYTSLKAQFNQHSTQSSNYTSTLTKKLSEKDLAIASINAAHQETLRVHLKKLMAAQEEVSG
jgi:hemoglobin-like flavoprotein